MAALFNQPEHDIIDHYTYIMCGDGDLMEGITSEAASLAGHLGLGKLICLYDDNGISIEGSTDLTFTEDVSLRFEAYNWHVITVEKGNDADPINDALQAAKAETRRPTLIRLQTHIAFGSPNKQDTAAAHGAPLGVEEVCLTKRNLGCPEDELFCVPDDALAVFRESIAAGKNAESDWNSRFEAYARAYPEQSTDLRAAISGTLPEGWDADIPDFSSSDPIATRAASGQVLNAIAEKVPMLIGGSADLAPSNNTIIKGSFDFQKDSYDGRNIRFGVREHVMGAILSGMALHGGPRPFGGTFLVFADYMRPSIRLAALMKLPVIYVFTHDSVAVGEDGPTHQPVEHVASLRIIPGLTVIRPADAAETAAAWRHAIQTADGPVALILSRQNLPVVAAGKEPPASGVSQGAYILSDSSARPDIILIASGSELHIAQKAGQQLSEKGFSARIVSMPSWELFERSGQENKDRVLPPDIPIRIAIEAGHPMGWRQYVGDRGIVIGIEEFGRSAPGGTVMEYFGFTAENIVEKALALLDPQSG
ncbi:MAG: transketolase [Desulfobacterales bacterium]